MIDYQKLTFDQVLNGLGENGNRLILSYNGDYRSIMGDDPCVNCSKGQGQFEKFKQKLNEMKDIQNSGFQLKAMYNGIQLGFGSKKILSNANLSDELAIEAINTHKLGKDLFSKLPENVDELMEGKAEKSHRQIELEKLKVPELKNLAKELEIEAEGNKAKIITDILAKEDELSK